MAFTIQLISSDGVSIPLPYSAAIGSKVIRNYYELPQDNMQVSLPNIPSKILSLVAEYLCYYCNLDCDPPVIETPLKTANFSELVPPWDCEFVERPHEELFELILAANYLDIQGLLALASAKVANMIKGKTPEQIKETFGIVNDFTPEEEAQIREENRWAEEL